MSMPKHRLCCGELGSEMLLDLRQVEISGLGLLREQLFGERLRSLVNCPKSKFPNTKQISQNKGADEANATSNATLIVTSKTNNNNNQNIDKTTKHATKQSW